MIDNRTFEAQPEEDVDTVVMTGPDRLPIGDRHALGAEGRGVQQHFEEDRRAGVLDDVDEPSAWEVGGFAEADCEAPRGSAGSPALHVGR